MWSRPVSERYFSLVADRQCGECMVCCSYMYINAPGLKKPADVLCDNCIVDKGCQIYDSRPNVCRTWHCLWRRVQTMSPELRPDKSGVIFSLNISYEPRHILENAYIVCMALADPSVFDTPAVSCMLDMFINDGSLPVWLSFQGSKTLAYPKPELADAIANPYTTIHKDLLEEGKIWSDRYCSVLEPLQARNNRFTLQFFQN